MSLFTNDQLAQIEGYLANDQTSEILPALEGLVADMEAYIDENCVATDDVQYFSFDSAFEKLVYRRIEDDPRTLEPAPRSFARAYSDFAFCLMRQNDFEGAASALKQAIRWNPVNCAYRLDLAAILTRLGDYEEFLKLSFSVFARSYSASHLVRAYLNFAAYFEKCGQYETAAACVKCAKRLNPDHPRVVNAASGLALDHQCNPDDQSDELTRSLLAAQGIPEGANVEVVLCALLFADISAAQGDMQTCKDMAQIAVGLVGQQKAMELAQIVREQGEENYPDSDGEGFASKNEYANPAAQATLDGAVRAAKQAAEGESKGTRESEAEAATESETEPEA